MLVGSMEVRISGPPLTHLNSWTVFPPLLMMRGELYSELTSCWMQVMLTKEDQFYYVCSLRLA